jgi:hypothetical protein
LTNLKNKDMGEPELIFHDTVPIEEERLPWVRGKAVKQKELILEIFRFNFERNFTPNEVHNNVFASHIILTSVRRSITDLTKEGRLNKCQWSESREGMYGKLNRTWRYNTEYVNPINPPKK